MRIIIILLFVFSFIFGGATPPADDLYNPPQTINVNGKLYNLVGDPSIDYYLICAPNTGCEDTDPYQYPPPPNATEVTQNNFDYFSNILEINIGDVVYTTGVDADEYVIYKYIPEPAPTCGSHSHVNSDNECECDTGYSSPDDNTSNCTCYVGNATVSFTQITSKQNCEKLKILRISGLEAYYHFAWNTCLNACIAEPMPDCQLGEVYDQDGQCVPATLDIQSCIAAGGTVKNIRYTTADACISNKNEIVAPCCQKVADCIIDSNPPKVLENIWTYVQCGDAAINDNSKCATCEDPTPIPTDDGICTNADESDYNSCPNPDNKCQNCPSDYPIADDYGDCRDSEGNVTICPIDDNTTNYMCTNCLDLGADWYAKGDGCERKTDAGILQHASCPTSNNSDTGDNESGSSSGGGGGGGAGGINTRPDDGSTFTDNDNNNTPSLGDNSGNAKDQNGSKVTTVTICNNCPPGYTSSDGICVLINANAQIVSSVPCPDNNTSQKYVPTSPNKALDENGSDSNITGNFNEMGNRGVDAIKKAYKNYSVFPTDCGQLKVMQPIMMFGGRVQINDLMPKFRDILYPYKNIIQNILIFIAVIIGLFNFFNRD